MNHLVGAWWLLPGILDGKQNLKEMDLKVKMLVVSMCRNWKAAWEILFKFFCHITNTSLCLFLTWQDMVEGFMFSSSINIWDFRENERVKIGIGWCRNPSFVSIYCSCGVENFLVVLIEIMHKAFEEWKLFCPTPKARYCKSTIGNEVF
jgi:hypothetical protein